jgi:putative transposase
MVPEYVPACENQTGFNGQKWVSLDPGVRTFQTLYSPHGEAYKCGDKDMNRIFRLCKHLDKLISNRKGKSAKYRRAMKKLRFRIRNLVDEVHWKTIHAILSRFNQVIVPPFETSQMIKRLNRKINTKTVRQMVCWRHYTFRQRLLHKAKQAGATVYVRDEAYTTKTCTNCFHINPNIRGEKVLKCPHCHIVVDRDLSGARNIFLKNTKAL